MLQPVKIMAWVEATVADDDDGEQGKGTLIQREVVICFKIFFKFLRLPPLPLGIWISQFFLWQKLVFSVGG